MLIVKKETSRQFLKKNMPSFFEMKSRSEALDTLYVLIDEKGFSPPDYYDYNDFGRAAQSAYDDIFESNPKS